VSKEQQLLEVQWLNLRNTDRTNKVVKIVLDLEIKTIA